MPLRAYRPSGACIEVEEFDARRSCRSQRHPDLYARRVEHRYLHLHAVLLYPRFESGRINPVLFQATLIAMGVATFSLVFATLHYYRCSLGGGMNDTDRASHARRADRFWLLGYTTMFSRQVWSCSSLGFVSSRLSGLPSGSCTCSSWPDTSQGFRRRGVILKI